MVAVNYSTFRFRLSLSIFHPMSPPIKTKSPMPKEELIGAATNGRNVGGNENAKTVRGTDRPIVRDTAIVDDILRNCRAVMLNNTLIST